MQYLATTMKGVETLIQIADLLAMTTSLCPLVTTIQNVEKMAQVTNFHAVYIILSP